MVQIAALYAITAMYHAWMSDGCAKYLRKTQGDLAIAQEKINAAISAGMQGK